MDENMQIDTAEDSKEKQVEGRGYPRARWLGRSEIISRRTIKTPKNEENREKMVGEGKKKERRKEGRETSGKNGEMARKEMKMKRARWLAKYKKKRRKKELNTA